ncbi:MAG: PfkB family carbohydrate kinase [Chloroflexota bacterium]
MSQAPDYLLIGHVAHDETPQGPKLGGTVSYAGCTANALGAHVAIVTSARKNEIVLDTLPTSIEVQLLEAPDSTVFVNTYVEGKRKQILRHRATPLTLADIPVAWRNAPIIHLGPLDDEVDPDLARAFPESLVAATPQGWMRTWDAEGVVFPKKWSQAEMLLPLLNVTVFSEEDIHHDTALEAHYASLSPLLVVTRADKGCTVYRRGTDPLHVTAPQVSVLDATGAGDVFAGVFLLIFQRTGSAQQAAEAATQLASISVSRIGLDGIPTPAEIEKVINTL